MNDIHAITISALTGPKILINAGLIDLIIWMTGPMLGLAGQKEPEKPTTDI